MPASVAFTPVWAAGLSCPARRCASPIAAHWRRTVATLAPALASAPEIGGDRRRRHRKMGLAVLGAVGGEIPPVRSIVISHRRRHAPAPARSLSSLTQRRRPAPAACRRSGLHSASVLVHCAACLALRHPGACALMYAAARWSNVIALASAMAAEQEPAVGRQSDGGPAARRRAASHHDRAGRAVGWCGLVLTGRSTSSAGSRRWTA